MAFTINPNKRRNALARQEALLERMRIGIGDEPAHTDVQPETPPAADPAPSDEAARQLMQTLWATLPPPGTTWSLAKRQAWLQSAEQMFSLIYKRED